MSQINQDEMHSMLFAQMVVQQTNMAMIFLGKTPHPQTGKTLRDLDGARLFIDQLEMLEVKTKGNLTKEEEMVLKQSLGHMRLLYVEAVNEQGKAKAEAQTEAAPGAPAETTGTAQAAEEEQRKRFTKKY